MSNTILLPSLYLPPISYFIELFQCDNVIIEKFEHFPKQTYRNRCHIYSPNGILKLSVPLRRGNNDHTAIKDVKISYEDNWQKIHWRSIESAYRSSAFFEFYEDFFKEFYETKTEYLLDLNTSLLETILKLLKYQTTINFTDTFEKAPLGTDLRNSFSAKSISKEYFFEEYHQVFSQKHGFIPNLTILDLLFNSGPQSLNIITGSIKKS